LIDLQYDICSEIPRFPARSYMSDINKQSKLTIDKGNISGVILGDSECAAKLFVSAQVDENSIFCAGALVVGGGFGAGGVARNENEWWGLACGCGGCVQVYTYVELYNTPKLM
jgi:hypothetical protein